MILSGSATHLNTDLPLTVSQVDGIFGIDNGRDLAMFNLAIDSKLRGRDVVALKVEDVAPGGKADTQSIVLQSDRRRPGSPSGSS
jgi:hypothetical protein